MSEIKFLELTKKECIEGGKQTALNEIQEAKSNLLDAYMYALAHIEFLQSFARTLHEHAMTEYEDYGEKDLEKFGRKITKFEAGVKYDYSNSNYPGYDQLVLSIERESAHRKNMETTMKTLKKKTTIVDDETGEVFEVNPPIKTSTTKLKISY